VKVVKNKVAPPFKQAEFDIIYGKGISNVGCILDMAVEADVVNKSGAWYSYEGTRIGQGRENSKEYISNNPELMDEIEKKVRQKFEIGDFAAKGLNDSSDSDSNNSVDIDIEE